MIKKQTAIFFILTVTLFSGCGKETGTDLPDQAKIEKAPATASEVVTQAKPAAARGIGSLEGTVQFSGTRPAATPINMSADPNCSSLHSGTVYTEAVEGNAPFLKNAFVYIKSGLEGIIFPLPREPAVIDQQGCQYHPHVLGLRVGQPLEIINSDATLHNVHGMPKNTKEFNLGMPIKGMRMKRIFDHPEVMVKFKCDVHPWMSAYAGVLKHPFFAVTGADGKFQINDVPVGKYTLAVWHETFGTLEQEVTVTPDGVITQGFEYPA